MDAAVLVVFLICLAVLLAMLLIIRGVRKRHGLSMKGYFRFRARMKKLKKYNEHTRKELKSRYPEHFVAALLPVQNKAGDIDWYVSWSNYVPAIIPLKNVSGIIVTEVEHAHGMVSLSGILAPAELWQIIGPGGMKAIETEMDIVMIDTVPETARQAIREKAKERKLPESLESLSALRLKGNSGGVISGVQQTGEEP